jgi:hypothetical protein
VNYRSMIAAIAAGIAPGGCTQSSVTGSNDFENSARTAPTQRSLSQAARIASRARTGSTLYVANNMTTTVTLYGTDGSGPNRTLKNGPRLQLRSLAFDKSSNLYVAMNAYLQCGRT